MSCVKKVSASARCKTMMPLLLVQMPKTSEIDKFTLTIDKLQVNSNVQFNSLLRFQKDEIYGLC